MSQMNCTGEAPIVPGKLQLYRGSSNCTGEAPIVPGKLQLYRGSSNCTGEPPIVPWKLQFYRGRSSFTEEVPILNLIARTLLNMIGSSRFSPFTPRCFRQNFFPPTPPNYPSVFVLPLEPRPESLHHSSPPNSSPGVY